jgi:glycosyltransferase involved in cell wall biosynthesis
MEAFLQSLDVFALSSLFGEGMPMSILEAMACRVCVVATDVAGAREVIKDGANGHLAPPGDVDALARCIELLVNDQSRRDQLARAGLETVRRHHSSDFVARAVERLYVEAVPDGPVSASEAYVREVRS